MHTNMSGTLEPPTSCGGIPTAAFPEQAALRVGGGSVSSRPSPTVRRRRLGLELRRLREAAGVTIETVADRLECSSSKISRIETGHTGATPRDVRDMLEVYGVSDAERDALVQLAREARKKGWWHAFNEAFTG